MFAGELCTGLCMVTALQYDTSLRGIPVSINTSYQKKARGRITATCAVSLPIRVGEQCATCAMIDRSGNVVATCEVKWIISEKKKKEQ